MEPTITLTFTQVFIIGGAVVGVCGTLFGSWLTLVLRKTPEVIDPIVRQRLSSHEDKCTERWEVMRETVKSEFAEIRKGIEGLYKRSWWR